MKDFLTKYNRPGPRYTSYPPAPYFNEHFTPDDYRESVIDSNSEEPASISIYIHIPFCPRLCHFCGCNTGKPKDPSHIKRYADALKKEIKMVSGLLDKNRPVTQIHWGGGTPNSIPYEYIGGIMELLKAEFKFHKNIEVAIECNPAYLSPENAGELAGMGFNRVSLGIQDFHGEVLEKVNRLPSAIPAEELVKHLRKSGFEGVNLDLMYGLPGQTPPVYTNTIKKAISLSPDRIVTFSYAHVPWFNPSMKKVEKFGLPSTGEKFNLFNTGYNLLTSAGYIPVGLDHYALPEDELSLALKERKLHRNFQGYCTKETTGQVYAFGSSSISQLWNAYSQNSKDYIRYIEKIEKGEFATEKGYRLNHREIITREVINSIMCNGHLNFSDIARNFGISADELKESLSYKQGSLDEFIEDGLVEIKGEELNVTRKGMLVVRNIAMAFDFMIDGRQQRYSKTI